MPHHNHSSVLHSFANRNSTMNGFVAFCFARKLRQTQSKSHSKYARRLFFHFTLTGNRIQTGRFHTPNQIGFWNEISLSWRGAYGRRRFCVHLHQNGKFSFLLLMISLRFFFPFFAWSSFASTPFSLGIELKNISKCSYHHHSVNLYTWAFCSFTHQTLQRGAKATKRTKVKHSKNSESSDRKKGKQKKTMECIEIV